MVAEQTETPWDPFEGWPEGRENLPMRVAELAGALGVKRDTFWLWARTGRVPAFKLGSRWYCTPSEVVGDIIRDRGRWAKSDTSVVYCYLQDKLRGTPRVPLEERPKPTGRHPGLVEPTPPQSMHDLEPPRAAKPKPEATWQQSNRSRARKRSS